MRRGHPICRGGAQGSHCKARQVTLSYGFLPYQSMTGIKLNRKSLFAGFIIQFIIIFILFSSCATTTKIGQPITIQLKDGVYEGNYTGGPNKAFVKVTIENNEFRKNNIYNYYILEKEK